ncbi:MAG: DNA-formamidopyrimidine glycosylase [Bacilli bacterium]|jgi:formamidopyrimidine-DNA glycosylase|nr:DNA-formamidopyrimidine glycosylase [Bacilli bacterium]
MPELPEVETVVQTLRRMIINKKIIKVEVFWNNIIDKITVKDFKDMIKNQKINEITRYGKVLIFELDNYYLLSHLRMEGKYFYDNKYIKDKHSHVIFYFDDNTFLRYYDTRKFGKISLSKKDELFNHPFLNKMGQEPFDITKENLYQKIHHKNIAIKTTLLDQHIIAGLGNIYVDEVLFLAKIHPETKSSLISIEQCQLIIDNAIDVLNKAIALGGTTIRSYTSSLGVSGRFQNELNVHTKANQPCPICQQPIIKIKVNGRGTYLCLNCQKKLLE